jgi:hypothetical protein
MFQYPLALTSLSFDFLFQDFFRNVKQNTELKNITEYGIEKYFSFIRINLQK